MLAGFVAGILIEFAHPLVVALGGGVLLIPRRIAVLTAAGVTLIGLGLGSLSAEVRAPERTAASVLASEVARCEVSGFLLEHLGNNASLVGISRAACTGRAPLKDLGALAFPRVDADAGTGVAAVGWLIPLEREGFDAYLRRSGALAGFHPVEMSTGRISSRALAIAAEVKGGLRSAVSALGSREGALLLGLTIGDTSRIDPVTEEHLRRAGLTHLVAVSGSNVAIVLGSLLLLVAFAGFRTRLSIAAAGLVLFVLVTGPEPSVLRAAAMGAIGLAALALGERIPTLRGLGLALLCVLALRPGMVGSLGLQLSVAATAGIILWARPISDRLTTLPRPVSLGIGATVAAQAAVAPLLAAGFGEVSVAGLPANLLAMPAVPPATILGFAGAVLGPLWAPGARFLVLLAGPFVKWILGVGDLFGGASWATVSVPPFAAALSGAAVLVAAIGTLIARARG